MLKIRNLFIKISLITFKVSRKFGKTWRVFTDANYTCKIVQRSKQCWIIFDWLLYPSYLFMYCWIGFIFNDLSASREDSGVPGGGGRLQEVSWYGCAPVHLPLRAFWPLLRNKQGLYRQFENLESFPLSFVFLQGNFIFFFFKKKHLLTFSCVDWNN